jgi:hypothetical protein
MTKISRLVFNILSQIWNQPLFLRSPGVSFGFFGLFFFGAGIEPKASHMPGKHCTTELQPSPCPSVSTVLLK